MFLFPILLHPRCLMSRLSIIDRLRRPPCHLVATVKWARLCSDMWGSMFGANARPVTPDFVAVTDARITVLVNELPQYLRRTPDFLAYAESMNFPHAIVTQNIVLLLVRTYTSSPGGGEALLTGRKENKTT